MRIFVLISLTIITSFAWGQDVIYKIDGSKVEAKVLEVSPATIKYKERKNPEGADYVIDRKEVLLIVYQNGEHDIIINFKRESGDSFTTHYGKNYVSLNFLDILFKNVSFSYERFFSNGYLGIRIPLILGFNDDYYTPTNKIIGFGLDLNYYPTGQGRVRYFVGPSIEVGLMRDTECWSVYNGGYYTYLCKDGEKSYYSVVLNNGVLFQLTKHFNLSLQFGIGLWAWEGRNANTHIRFGANIGYRF